MDNIWPLSTHAPAPASCPREFHKNTHLPTTPTPIAPYAPSLRRIRGREGWVGPTNMVDSGRRRSAPNLNGTRTRWRRRTADLRFNVGCSAQLGLVSSERSGLEDVRSWRPIVLPPAPRGGQLGARADRFLPAVSVCCIDMLYSGADRRRPASGRCFRSGASHTKVRGGEGRRDRRKLVVSGAGEAGFSRPRPRGPRSRGAARDGAYSSVGEGGIWLEPAGADNGGGGREKEAV